MSPFRCKEWLLKAALRDQEAARRLQIQLDQQRCLDLARMEVLQNPQWWDQASPEQIGAAYEVVRTWRDVDPVAVRAEQQMAEQLHQRYGINITDQATDPAMLSGQVADVQKVRAQAREEAEEAARLTRDAEQEQREAEQLPTDTVEQTSESTDQQEEVDATAEDAEDAHQAEDRSWDSAESREERARELAQHLDPELREARTLADQAQGTPPSAATKPSRKGWLQRVRRGKNRGRGQEHDGLQR